MRRTLTASYRPVVELGRGGMGTATLARLGGEAGFSRLAVVKRMYPHMLGDDQAVRRFLDEARTASHVHHANVVGVQQVGRDDEGYFLVLDYVEGDSLDGLVRRLVASGERTPMGVVLRIVADALAGLHAVHEATDAGGVHLGILHRDVTPQNLLVGTDGVTRLADFGVAKTTVLPGVTAQHHVVGKVLYMPPEYLMHKPVDRRLDVYGIGVTTWIGIAGCRPYHGTSEGELVLKMVRQGLPKLSTIRDDVPPALDAFVAKATARAPDERFSSAREMSDALAEIAPAIALAHHADVALLVDRLVGPDLAKRRQSVARLATSNEATLPAHVEVPVEPSGSIDAVIEVEESPRPKPIARWLVPAAGVVVGLGVTAVGVFLFGVDRGAPVAASSRPEVTESPSVVVPPVPPSAAAAPEPSATTSAAPRGAPSKSRASSDRSTPAKSAAPPEARPPDARPPDIRPPDGVSTANPYR